MHKHLTIFSLVALLLLLVSGCSNMQQVRTISPYFDGSIRFNDEPLPQIKVTLSTATDDVHCRQAYAVTHTDEAGQFSLKAATENYRYIPFANYQLDYWSVCASFQGETYTLYNNNRYASGNISESIVLDCDLAQRPLEHPCAVSH